MDPLTSQLMVGLVVNGLGALLGRSLAELTSEIDQLETAVEQAISEALSVEEIASNLGGERLRAFLVSPQAHAIVRRIFACKGLSDEATIDEARAEFSAILAFHMADDKEIEQSATNRLFDSLVDGVNQALEQVMASGSIQALDARTQVRHRQLIAKLDLVQASISDLTHHGVTSSDLREFVRRYEQQVYQREGTIVPPDFDVATKVPIDALYVESPLESFDKGEDRALKELSYAELFANIQRRVVLGNPGSGKSTLAKKLVADHAKGAGHEESLVPFLVVLRDYGARKAEASCSIREFLEARISSHYQLEAPPGAVEYLLTSGAALVVFDGLDELLDTSYRQQISADIESFSCLYPSVPILVTSREVGYPQAPLDADLFESFRLAPFIEGQVQEYVTKWFARDADLSAAEKEQQVQAFMRESSIVPDLRSNPLMLALMCNLYKGEGYIPRNRPDVFERCAVMLFDRWDRQRQITVPLEIESHIRPAMQYLAHWIYIDSGLEVGVGSQAIVAKTTEYLVGRRYDDPADAELEANKFVEFCAGRAWVFTDLGTTPSGEPLYNFTHRTFLEYFTAGHLVRLFPSAERLAQVLLPHIEQREWDVVAQLSFQMLDKNVDGGGAELIEELLTEEMDLGDQRELNRLAFVVRTLEFLVPPPALVRTITHHVVSGVLRWLELHSTEGLEGLTRGGREIFPLDVLQLLASANAENLPAVVSALESEFGPAIDAEGARGVPAAELALMLAPELPDLDSRILASYGGKLDLLAKQSVGIGVEMVGRGRLGLADFVARYGLDNVLSNTSIEAYPHRLRSALASSILFSLLHTGNVVWGSVGREHAQQCLTELAPILVSTTPPWHVEESIRLGLVWPPVEGEQENIRASDLSADQWFAAAALFAALIEETESQEDEQRFVHQVIPGLIDRIPIISPIFHPRYDDSLEEDASQLEVALGFSNAQQVLLSQWRQRAISLARHQEREPKGI
jgi:hypothetical protein